VILGVLTPLSAILWQPVLVVEKTQNNGMFQQHKLKLKKK
jgi:hypothetical protein